MIDVLMVVHGGRRWTAGQQGEPRFGIVSGPMQSAPAIYRVVKAGDVVDEEVNRCE